MKHIILYSLMCTAVFSVIHTEKPIQNRSTQPSPLTIEFAWDLHGVVLKQRKRSLVRHLFRNMPCFLGISIRKKHKHLRKLLKKLRKESATGEEYKMLLLRHGQHQAARCIEKCAVEQTLRKGMKQLILDLNTLGYTQRICSNIGSTFLPQVAKKHPQLFNCFKNGTCSEYMDSTEVIKKPDIRFYKKHNEAYNLSKQKIIIFIDDKQENVDAANQIGWKAIKYTNAKQLRIDLKNYGIFV